MAVDNVRNVAVVANNTDKTISVVNLATRAVTNVPTQIPAAPYSVAVNPITGIALIAYQSTNIGALIDLTQTPPVFIGAVTLTTGLNPQRLRDAVTELGSGDRRRLGYFLYRGFAAAQLKRDWRRRSSSCFFHQHRDDYHHRAAYADYW